MADRHCPAQHTGGGAASLFTHTKMGATHTDDTYRGFHLVMLLTRAGGDLGFHRATFQVDANNTLLTLFDEPDPAAGWQNHLGAVLQTQGYKSERTGNHRLTCIQLHAGQ